uniref:Kinesin-associated protein 3 n=1 Tax=Syphacia muris TaxID=451379 RepID=A0A0N5AKS1_9BILA
MESGENLVEYRKIKTVKLDAHNKDTAIIVRYEVDEATNAEEFRHDKNRWCQKTVKLKNFNDNSDISSIAQYVINCCPFLKDGQLSEVEQILYYLQKRQKLFNADRSSENESPCSTVPSSSVSMDKVEEYIEMLYEQTPYIVSGTASILQLSNDIVNVKSLVENEILIGALARVLKDEWKKSFDVAINIVSIFYNFSLYSDFHTVLVQYRIGTLCMQLIDNEIKNWNEKTDCTSASAKSSSIILRKQQDLITVCFNLLLNLAEDLKVEFKMVNRNLLEMLVKVVGERNVFSELLMVVINFLIKLSLFAENQQIMRSVHLVDALAALFPIDDNLLRRSVFRLLFNLSFDIATFNQIVTAELVPHITAFINVDECSMNLLYRLSTNDNAKAIIAYTDAVQALMGQLVSGKASDVAKGLLVNIALERRNAHLICASDGSGLDLIATAAFSTTDKMLIKVLRNIASHSESLHKFFFKWAHNLLEKAISFGEDERYSGYALDCLGTVNIISSLNWEELVESMSLVPWIQKVITSINKETKFPPDFILQVVILCSTMAQHLNVARLLVPFVNNFIDLLSAQQEDDEMVIQVVYLFYVLITHEELSDALTSSGAQIGAYLLDLMHDRNLPIRTLCDATLSIFAQRSEEWSQKMDVERFRRHNAQWLEMIADGNGALSCDSTLSASPDSFNVFGAEELLDDAEVARVIILMVRFALDWSNRTVRSASFGAAVCFLCTLFLIFCVSITRSLVLTSATWLSVFSLFLLISTVVSCSVSKKPTPTNTFGYSRTPVMAVFSATVLVSLSAIFLIKECSEHLLEGEHHAHSHNLYLFGAAAVSTSLITAAYGTPNQPFQHVLTASSSSSLQEHFADVSHALCYIVPGLSILLLPRLNALSILAFLTTCACCITHWYISELWYIDAGSALVLSICVFMTMWPLSKYTGRMLLQTSPPHIHNQIDRCISEASTIEGVLELRNAHFWQLDFSSMVGSIDVRVRRDADEQLILASVTEKLSPVVSMLTIQVVKDVAAAWQNFDGLNPPTITSPFYSETGDTHSTNPNLAYVSESHTHDGHSHGTVSNDYNQVKSTNGHNHSEINMDYLPEDIGYNNEHFHNVLHH